MSIHRISNDSWIFLDTLFLQGLLGVFPFASDDTEARSAIWSILARLLVRIQKSDPSSLHQHVSVLTSKSEVVEDELLNYNADDSSEDPGSSTKLTARTIAVSFFIYIHKYFSFLEIKEFSSLASTFLFLKLMLPSGIVGMECA